MPGIAIIGPACIAAALQLGPFLAPLFRAAVVADRATVILLTQEPTLVKTVDLSKARCGGPGRRIVCAVEISPPWQHITLHFIEWNLPYARIMAALQLYPDSTVTHSHSRYGLFVSEYLSRRAGEFSILGIDAASLPLLEHVEQKLEGKSDQADMRWLLVLRDAGTRLIFKAGETIEHFASDGSPAYYDFVVTDDAVCEFYQAKSKGEVKCLVKSVLPSRLMDKTPTGYVFKSTYESYRTPGSIFGPFAVVPHNKARYLVTAAGTLVKLVDDHGKPLAAMATVYDQSRILAVIHDADKNKRYAFTATHFFEVAEPLQHIPHAVKRFDATHGAVALETAFHCGRAVRGLPPVPFPPPKP